MSRWGKNIVVPLDSLYKEKENTNRPTVARSVGTVGKWGKMGFTSTRTYTLSALPAAVAAAAAAAAAASPGQSPASALDDDMSPSVPEPPKPKKFFKSRNTAPPEVIAQIMQNLPRATTSPNREIVGASSSMMGTPTQGREPIKLKIAKSASAEKKKKSPKKPLKSLKSDTSNDVEQSEVAELLAPTQPSIDQKPKKKKEEKRLKPEAPPSRIIARARKAVNYCEDDEDERSITPMKDILYGKHRDDLNNIAHNATPKEPVLPPPPTPAIPLSTSSSGLTPPAAAPKTPEHPPIVLRISKGTSRLVSTDSEEQPGNTTASPSDNDIDPFKSPPTFAEDSPAPTTFDSSAVSNTPKIIVKPPKPPSPAQPTQASTFESNDDPSEINYCTVKISPDKPPKERLKLIIKTDVIRNAIAAAAKAAAAKVANTNIEKCIPNDTGSSTESDRPEREKKSKSKKHKHLKHSAAEQLIPVPATVHSEFKTPSPNLALGSDSQTQLTATARTIISPPALSERDFDSQSSVLGSISSKGNSTPHLITQVAPDESCVVRSRGSSVITSDLETSQHSSLVAPPSDIELRLESMMMDNETKANEAANLIAEEPLQEDILSVLRGDEADMDAAQAATIHSHNPKLNGAIESNESLPLPEPAVVEAEPAVETAAEIGTDEQLPRRITRGRNRAVPPKSTPVQAIEKEEKNVVNSRTRARKHLVSSPPLTEDTPIAKRPTRRTGKRDEDVPAEPLTVEINQPSPSDPNSASVEKLSPNNSEEENTPVELPAAPPTKRSRSTRNISNNNNLSNNNNNINKIAASLSAKAGAAEAVTKDGLSMATAAAATAATTATPTAAACAPTVPRSYGGRKRKNQQVTQVLQPPVDELDEQSQPHPGLMPPKACASNEPPLTETGANMTNSSKLSPSQADAAATQLTSSSATIVEDNIKVQSNALRVQAPSSPPRRDYQIKDKFKRTLMLDNQDEEHQRGSVKLVISKKKGSIFKSRALVPADQTEQAGAATKRHLYKHRWDAEINGGHASDSGSSVNSNDGQASTAPRPPTENAFGEFNEDSAKVTQTRDNSPSLVKLNRNAKPNPQYHPSANTFEMDVDEDEPNDAIPTFRSDRKTNDYYTRVCNVKTAHQIQEIGEYQEMDDDVEYILDALKPENPTATRCLSALQLAAKCMTPAFRMHVRAHGVVTKFFKALSDANSDLSLGLCTSAIMFILSQEGLNMDLDRDALELMMNLLESEGVAAPSDQANYERNRQKVREFCEEIKAQGKAAHLNVDSITVGTLAMETLLSLTSKRAGEWFKEELRKLGGLEHIIKTISDCSNPITNSNQINWTQGIFENMQTVSRCMRVLENVTQMNEENQKYMLTFGNGSALTNLCTLYFICNRELKINLTHEHNTKENTVLLELLTSLLKVLINLTHTFNPSSPVGAEMIGQRFEVITTSLHLLLHASSYIPDRCVFELSILVLLLLINLTMYTKTNRDFIMKSNVTREFSRNVATTDVEVTAVQAVMEYFYKCEELARLVEKSTDDILDNTNKNKKKQEELDETVNNLLQTAGHHMEHTLKGSYAGILIGHLITDSEEYEAIIRTHLHGNGFKEIISVLEKYYTFMNLTASSEASVIAHMKSLKKLIDYFKKRDLVFEMNEPSDSALPLNLETHQSTSPENATVTRSTQRVYKTYSQR